MYPTFHIRLYAEQNCINFNDDKVTEFLPRPSNDSAFKNAILPSFQHNDYQ